MTIRFPDSFEDLTPDQLRQVLDGFPLTTSYGEELRDVFSQLLDFATHVSEGGAWPSERVHIMRLRANNLCSRLAFTPTYPEGITDDG